MKKPNLKAMLAVAGGLAIATGACTNKADEAPPQSSEAANEAEIQAPVAMESAATENSVVSNCSAAPCASKPCAAKPCAAKPCGAKPCAPKP